MKQGFLPIDFQIKIAQGDTKRLEYILSLYVKKYELASRRVDFISGNTYSDIYITIDTYNRVNYSTASYYWNKPFWPSSDKDLEQFINNDNKTNTKTELETLAIKISGDAYLAQVIGNYYKLSGRKIAYSEEILINTMLLERDIYLFADADYVQYASSRPENYSPFLATIQNMNQIHNLFYADYKARHEPQKPKINGCELDYINREDKIVGFGCTKISISFLRNMYDNFGAILNSNKTLQSITLDGDVQLTREQIKEILDYYDKQ